MVTATLILFAIQIVASVASIIISLASNRQEAPKAQEFNATTNSETAVIPVVFGVAKVNAPCWIHFDQASLEVNPVTVSSGGGKGKSADTTVGYKYRANYEQVLCQGACNAVYDVRTTNGGRSLFQKSGGAGWRNIGQVWNFWDYNTRTTQGDFSESGTVKVTAGGSTTDIITKADGSTETTTVGVSNATMIRYGVNGKYDTGGTGSVPAHQWIIQRVPTSLNTGDSKYPNIYVRGSKDENAPEYRLMNPAAIVYECIFTSLLGFNLDPKVFCDAESFYKAAEFYADSNIGLGLCVTSAISISDFINKLQNHVDFNLVWNNGKLSFQSNDLTSNLLYSPIIMDADIKEGTLSIARLTSQEICNSVAYTFTQQINYDPGTARLVDSYATELAGYESQKSVDLTGYQSLSSAQKRASQLLRKWSYPAVTIKFTTSRAYSYLKVGDMIRIATKDTTTGKYRVFVTRVSSIDSSTVSNGEIDITAAQDTKYNEFLTTDPEQVPEAGASVIVITPDQDTITVNPGEPAPAPSAINTGMVMETSKVLLSRLETLTGKTFGGYGWNCLALAQRTYNLSTRFMWTAGTAGNLYTSYSNYGLSAVLSSPMDVFYTDRDNEYTITCETRESFDALLASSINIGKGTAGGLDEILKGASKGLGLLIVGKELMQVGKYEILDEAALTLKMSGIVRGALDSTIVSHSIGEKVWVISNVTELGSLFTSLPINNKIESYLSLPVTMYPQDISGTIYDEDPFTTAFTHPQSGNTGFYGLSETYGAPDIRKAYIETTSGDLVVQVRPFSKDGAGIKANIDVDLNNLNNDIAENVSVVMITAGGTELPAIRQTATMQEAVLVQQGQAPTTDCYNILAIDQATGKQIESSDVGYCVFRIKAEKFSGHTIKKIRAYQGDNFSFVGGLYSEYEL